MKLGGRLSAPTIDADVHALDLAGMQFSLNELRATASGELATPRLQFQADAPSAVIADETLSDVHVGGQLDGDVLTIGGLTASQGVNPGRVSLAGTSNLPLAGTTQLRIWRSGPSHQQPRGRLPCNSTRCSPVPVR